MNYKTGLLFLLLLSIYSCNQDVKFDSEKWKNAGGENIMLDTRLNMANDLIESNILINKSEPEIIELIGSRSRLHGSENDTLKYFAVQEIYGLDIDPEEITYLKILFNNKGKSISVELFSTK